MASSISLGIYFAIAGAVFLDDYKVPAYTFKDWQLLAGVPLGLFAALVVTVLAGFMMGATRLSPGLLCRCVALGLARLPVQDVRARHAGEDGDGDEHDRGGEGERHSVRICRRCRSPLIRGWSRHSRRSVPTYRSAKDLHVLGNIASGEERQPAEQPDHEEIDEANEHERRG